MKRMSDVEVRGVAASMLRYAICRHCHGKPRNIDRIRKAFNRKAMDWVADQKKESK